MEAITREEKIISGENLTPITRKEMFLAKASGQSIQIPTPITREEIFLSKITGGGGGSGGGNNPLAYTVSSVDELPSDAVDGSMAVVTAESDTLGTWVFNDELTLDENLNTNPEFEAMVYGDTQICNKISLGTTGPGAKVIKYTIKANNASPDIYGYDNNYGMTVGWYKEEYKTIKITKSPTDENSFSWVRTNAKQTEKSVVSTLYIRENGSWIYKTEIV